MTCVARQVQVVFMREVMPAIHKLFEYMHPWGHWGVVVVLVVVVVVVVVVVLVVVVVVVVHASHARRQYRKPAART
jgi:hypothetical protein